MHISATHSHCEDAKIKLLCAEVGDEVFYIDNVAVRSPSAVSPY